MHGIYPEGVGAHSPGSSRSGAPWERRMEIRVAKPPKSFDVWFVAVNTVYKAVPYQVVADWTQQGRLSAGDKLRAAGVEEAWKPVNEWECFADYLPRPAFAQYSATPETDRSN